MVNGTHQSVPTAQSFLRSFPFLQLDGDSHTPSALTLLAASVPGLVLLPPVRALCPTVHRLPFLLHPAPSPPAYLWIRPLLLALDFVFLNKQPNQGGEGLNFCTPPTPLSVFSFRKWCLKQFRSFWSIWSSTNLLIPKWRLKEAQLEALPLWSSFWQYDLGGMIMVMDQPYNRHPSTQKE